MIISASRRTDIPAFYTEWFINRLRAGYCMVMNPFNPRQVTRVSLRPDDVEVIVFWTRDARPLLPYVHELDERGYRYYFQYTLTDYCRVFEPKTPLLPDALDTMTRLAEHIGPERLCWRYDPIIFTDTMPPEWHSRHFALLAERLRGLTRRVTISLMDSYRNAMKRLTAAGITLFDISSETDEFRNLMQSMARTAGEQRMTIASCAETVDLRPYGIAAGKCIDDAYIRRIFGLSIPATKDSSQRAACGCVVSKDIGAYDTCLHGCIYCYATHQPEKAIRRFAVHDINASSLQSLTYGDDVK